MRCLICNSEINEGELFCKNCGINSNSQQNNTDMFNQPDKANNVELFNNQSNLGQNNSFTFESNNLSKQIDNKEVLIDAYIGKNVDELKDGSFSWCSLFFGIPYIFYRKMWLLGIIWILLRIGITFVRVIFDITTPSLRQLIEFFRFYSSVSIISFFAPYVLTLIMAIIFKKLYIKKVGKQVIKIKNRNQEKTELELKEMCSKKGGTSIIAAATIILLYLALFAYSFFKTKELYDNINQSAVEDTARGIISSVELAHAYASISPKSEIITLEEIRKEYNGRSSTWNDDNTIIPTSTLYNFVCNVTVNSNNEMLVSCDVNGKIIESELMSLNTGKGNNGTTDNLGNNTISYRIEKETIEGQPTNNKLYVNNKLVNFMNDASSIKVEQLGDVLLVERRLSSAVLFVVDKNANVIGVFGNKHSENDKGFNLLQTKLYYRDTYRIDGNDIYVQTDQLGNGGEYNAMCNEIIDDNEVVICEEKFTYLGDNKFSNPTATKQVTRKQYMQEHNITCNTKELLKEKDLIVKKSSNSIIFYKNGKKIGNYYCKGSECEICIDTMTVYGPFSNSNSKIYESGKVALYDFVDGNTNIIVFDIYNNKIYDTHKNIVDSCKLGDKYILVKNKDNQMAILNKDYVYIKKYSNKHFLYRDNYVGNNNFNVEKDMIISIKDNKYGIEKISKNETIINHKYNNITLTDGITVYSTNDKHERNFYYTDELYQDKYFKAKSGNKWYLYYLNNDKKVIDKGYDRLYLIDKNTIAVYEDGKISFIDYKGKSISNDKIEVYISSEKFYQSPEGIRFILNGNVVNIYVDIEKSTQQHHYEYNLETKKVTKVN